MEERPALKPGLRPCLKCGKTFRSVNLTTNKICPKCNRENEREREGGLSSSSFVYVNGSRIPIGDN